LKFSQKCATMNIIQFIDHTNYDQNNAFISIHFYD